MTGEKKGCDAALTWRSSISFRAWKRENNIAKKLQDKHVPIVKCLSAPTFSKFIFLCAS